MSRMLLTFTVSVLALDSGNARLLPGPDEICHTPPSFVNEITPPHY